VAKNEELALGPDLQGLLETLTPVIKKKLGKIPKPTVRGKPTFIETQSAVAGILEGGDETDESKSYASDLDLPPVIESVTFSELISEVEMSPTSYAGRPKRKSFLDASAKFTENVLVDQESKGRNSQSVVPSCSEVVDLPLQPDLSLPLNCSPRTESLFEREGTADINSPEGGAAAVVNEYPSFQDGLISMSEQTEYDDVNKHVYINGKIFFLFGYINININLLLCRCRCTSPGR
jgi:hypothetical protein